MKGQIMTDSSAEHQPSFLPIFGALCILAAAGAWIFSRLLAFDPASPVFLVILAFPTVLLGSLLLRNLLASADRDPRLISRAAFLATLPIAALSALLLANDFAQTVRTGRSGGPLSIFSDFRLPTSVLVLLGGTIAIQLLADVRGKCDQIVVWALAGTCILADLAAIGLVANFLGSMQALELIPTQDRLSSTLFAFFALLALALAVVVVLCLTAIALAEVRSERLVKRVATLSKPIHHTAAACWLVGYLYFLMQSAAS